jgi:hypothetical protein
MRNIIGGNLIFLHLKQFQDPQYFLRPHLVNIYVEKVFVL